MQRYHAYRFNPRTGAIEYLGDPRRGRVHRGRGRGHENRYDLREIIAWKRHKD